MRVLNWCFIALNIVICVGCLFRGRWVSRARGRPEKWSSLIKPDLALAVGRGCASCLTEIQPVAFDLVVYSRTLDPSDHKKSSVPRQRSFWQKEFSIKPFQLSWA
jgi:hypothetical protein